jgi:hypothetical protein
MKVVELKKELKARGQDTAGLKKDLRNRLINAILKDIQQGKVQAISAQNRLYSASESVIVEESQEEQEESSDSMNVSKDSREKVDMEEENISPRQLPIDNGEISQKCQRKESISSMEVEHHSEPVEQAKETLKDNFTNLVSSEQKKEKAQNRPKFVPKKPESSLSAIKEMDVVTSNSSSAQISDGEAKSELTEMKMKKFSEMKKESDMSEGVSGPPSEVSYSSKTSGNSVKDMVSKFSGFSSGLSSSNNGSALSKGLQAKKEARQAKIAEMRAKVRL